MLIYNTTYQVDMNDARNFVIWLTECYIPEVEKNGKLNNARLTQILSHQDPPIIILLNIIIPIPTTFG